MVDPMAVPESPIFVARHGETEFNREGRYNGVTESHLTAKGVEEARRNGRALRPEVVALTDLRFVSSPLGRAQQTARIIREELGLIEAAIDLEERLTEISFGEWEGLTREEIESRFPGELDKRRQNKWTYRFPGGESYAMVAQRAGAWLSEVRGPVIAVTHGAVYKVLRGLYAGLPEQEIGALDEPQDVLFKLADGQVSRI